VRYASPAKTVVGFDVRRNARDARYGSWRVKDAPLGGRLTICRRHGDSLWRLCDPVRRKFAVGTTTVRDVKANGSISTISIRKRLLCLGGGGTTDVSYTFVTNERVELFPAALSTVYDLTNFFNRRLPNATVTNPSSKTSRVFPVGPLRRLTLPFAGARTTGTFGRNSVSNTVRYVRIVPNRYTPYD